VLLLKYSFDYQLHEFRIHVNFAHHWSLISGYILLVNIIPLCMWLHYLLLWSMNLIVFLDFLNAIETITDDAH